MNKQIKPPPICQTHQRLLVDQTGYKESDPWRALVVMANIALFQATTADDKFQKDSGGDIKKIESLGCLACYKPDAFGEIVEAGKSKDFGKIKRLGEKWVGV